MTFDQIVQRLHELARPEVVAGMGRVGIATENNLGVGMAALRALAREIGRDHELAGRLWATGIHDARLLASMVEEPRAVTPEQMDRWAADFRSWDLCDQCCGDLFDRTPYAYAKAAEWGARPEEFVRRAAFALMAWLAVHDKRAPDERLAEFLPIIAREAGDGRNMVRKAQSWALRSIGKRSLALNARAVALSRVLAAADDRSARWVGADALKELTGDAAQVRLHARAVRRPGARG
jgi:3-methyladenine DNA glycosylase AlkD